MFSPMNVYASLLAWSGSVLYLVSARVPERWQGRMNYTVDVVPTLGAYMLYGRGHSFSPGIQNFVAS